MTTECHPLVPHRYGGEPFRVSWILYDAMHSSSPVYVLGVGLTKLLKPRGKVDYTELGFEAGIKALLDAQITYDDIDQGVACYCYGDSTCGQRVFYQFGMTGIPIYNVNNNCSTGSTGLFMARSLIKGGQADCVIVIGFEKMSPGSLKSAWTDRENPTGRLGDMMQDTVGFVPDAPGAAQMFGNAGIEYCTKYGAQDSDMAEIARVNHAHSVNNPYSQFRTEYTLDEIQSSPTIHGPLTKLQCCPTSDGGAAAILVSDSFLQTRPHLRSRAILIAGQALRTDTPSLFNRSAISLMGYEMTTSAALAAYAEAGLPPPHSPSLRTAINVVELHDCFSANELLTLDSLGLCERGKAHEMVRAGNITYKCDQSQGCVVNPSGGLISKGHPLGATGLAQCAELVWQLRGWAGARLVPDATVAVQHNLGLGGAVVVTVYRKSGREDDTNEQLTDSESDSDSEIARQSWCGYNPATQARGFTREMVERVRSQDSKRRSPWADADTERKVMARF